MQLIKFLIDRVSELPDEMILSYWGGNSAVLLHPLIRKASVIKGMNILIIFYLMFSIAEGPVGAHSGRTVAQHTQK